MTRFRALRLKKGLSQTEFRQQYNRKYNRSYTAAAISQIEHGKRMPELGALKDFADFYGVNVDYLLVREEDAGSNGAEGKRLSAQLKALVEGLPEQKPEEVANEARENVEMLRSLLRQSMILARRVERDNIGM